MQLVCSKDDGDQHYCYTHQTNCWKPDYKLSKLYSDLVPTLTAITQHAVKTCVYNRVTDLKHRSLAVPGSRLFTRKIMDVVLDFLTFPITAYSEIVPNKKFWASLISLSRKL